MEQIKDMVTLRAYAVEKASILPVKDVIEAAREITSYVLGDATLPESYEDKTMDMYKDFMKEIAPKPQVWIKPSEMLPKEEEKVLCHIDDSNKVYFGSYDGTAWWIEIDNGLVCEGDSDFRVVSWLPIPEYNGKLV